MLAESYHYPFRFIGLGQLVRIGDALSRHYLEADILVTDKDGHVTTIFSVAPPGTYKKYTTIAVDELFQLASALAPSGQIGACAEIFLPLSAANHPIRDLQVAE